MPKHAGEGTEPVPTNTNEVLAVSMLMRAFEPMGSRESIRALLATQVETVAQELADVRATAYQAGYEKGRRDALSGEVDPYNLYPDAPSYAELQRIRGLEPNKDYESGWGPIPSTDPEEYLGGRWPGKRRKDV